MQTVDFFTPIVDDPFIYGQIAAANALSDIYAMGARPRTALAIAGFPKKDLEPATIRQVFLGGFQKLEEAGVALLGGHTIQDPEIKFGYAVTGEVDPDRMLTNAGARAGDELYLTKPIGTGVIGTAIKFQRAPDVPMQAAIRAMVRLNRDAADALRGMPPGAVHACTDVTGFGLIGHASEVAQASGVTLRIEAARVPLITGVLELVRANQSGGLVTNQDHFGPHVRGADSIDTDRAKLLFDPQTSGGLLIAVAPEHAHALVGALDSKGVPAARIGAVIAPVAGIWIDLI